MSYSWIFQKAFDKDFGINKLQTAFFMYKVMNNLVPSFFVNMFTVNSGIHNYNTR